MGLFWILYGFFNLLSPNVKFKTTQICTHQGIWKADNFYFHLLHKIHAREIILGQQLQIDFYIERLHIFECWSTAFESFFRHVFFDSEASMEHYPHKTVFESNLVKQNRTGPPTSYSCKQVQTWCSDNGSLISKTLRSTK